jgi:hypothetical protein
MFLGDEESGLMELSGRRGHEVCDSSADDNRIGRESGGVRRL